MPVRGNILTVNAGSSTIRFACFRPEDGLLVRGAGGKVERTADGAGQARLLARIDAEIGLESVRAVGHRVVHGFRHSEPARVTPELLEELRGVSAFDPEHLPSEIELMEAFQERDPGMPQVACFDTAFHRHMPRVARILPIPRRFEAMGIERYGFHGLSYTYLIGELRRVAGEAAANGRVILAHLGSGASLAALRDGKSLDTSMGFTPAGGIPMATRAGDLDAGLAAYLMGIEGMSADRFARMVHHESGLLGVSETSGDMRDLLACEAQDVRASEAVGMFCYQTRKWIGAFAAALGGLDTLVFSGGIGENAPEVRSRICGELGFLGIVLDEAANGQNAAVISGEEARVSVRVIPTDEERVIAQVVVGMVPAAD